MSLTRITLKLLTAIIPSLLESSSLGGNVFQSTVLDGHCMCPDFDLSVIKGTTETVSDLELMV